MFASTKAWTLMASLVLTMGPALAQDGQPPSLQELLAWAERDNPGLRAAQERWIAAQQMVPQARALPDPQLSYGYMLEPVHTRVGPQEQRLELTQKIPLFGKRGLRAEVASEGAAAAEAIYQQQRLELRHRVTELWNEYYFLGRAQALTEESVRLMTHLESVALTQYAAGRGSHSAVVRAQLELGKLEDQLRSLHDRSRSQRARLNLALDRPADTELAMPSQLEFVANELSLQELAAQLSARNPRLSYRQSMVARQDAARRLASRSAIPDLMLGGEWIVTGDAIQPNTPDGGSDALIAKASISVPLWFGRYRAERAQAQAEWTAAEREFRETQNLLQAELEQTHYELRDSKRREELYSLTLIPKAREALYVTEDAFKAAQASFLELIDAQRTLLEFELALERARSDRATREADLQRLVGIVAPAQEEIR